MAASRPGLWGSSDPRVRLGLFGGTRQAFRARNTIIFVPAKEEQIHYCVHN